jgi:hypothetical protein
MIQDCHFNDLTAIVNARVQARAERKAANRRRYHRHYRRKLCGDSWAYWSLPKWITDHRSWVRFL